MVNGGGLRGEGGPAWQRGGTCVVKGACMVGGHVWWWGCVHGRGHV